MTCHGIARRCDASQPRPYRLRVGLDRPIRRLCNACCSAAMTLGYEPAPVPEWVARGKGKVLGAA